MLNIYELVTLEVQNEHNLEHDLTHKKLFSTPKIYDAKGDLSKRWYVYFTYLNPKTGKLERMKNIYGKTNRYKTKDARYTILRVYKKRLTKLLNEGYNPLIDNSKHHESQISNSKKKSIDLIGPIEVNNSEHSLEDAIEFALELKTNVISSRTFVDYKNRCKTLVNWFKENEVDISNINNVKKKSYVDFLNAIQLKTSPRNRNNYKTCLSSIFQSMEDNDIIEKNYFKNISQLKTNPQRNKTYSIQQQEEIFEYLETKDPILLLYIKFISYNFLRPIEVCRLKVKDIDIENKILQFKAKNKSLKTKIIPEILIKELPDLSNIAQDFILFTPEAIGANWDTQLTNRRDYFSKRFKNVVKDHFGLDRNFGLYSFRHTFITRLYRALVQDSSPFAAKSSLMQITGHTTMTALEKYLRDIDAELPNDYSKFL